MVKAPVLRERYHISAIIADFCGKINVFAHKNPAQCGIFVDKTAKTIYTWCAVFDTAIFPFGEAE